ncbi:GFA family protein [Streptomyces nigrescens]
MSTPPREKDALSASPDGSLRSGSCLCRRIRFTVTGSPDYRYTCSCTHRQRLDHERDRVAGRVPAVGNPCRERGRRRRRSL